MFLKRDDPHLLIVGMTGVKMGDRFVQIGCAHGGRLAAVAGKVGLSGRAVARRAGRSGRGARVERAPRTPACSSRSRRHLPRGCRSMPTTSTSPSSTTQEASLVP